MNRHVTTSAPLLQRVAGTAAISVRSMAGRTRLDRLFQEGAAKIRLPATEGDHVEVVLINTAGGLTGGDRLEWRASVGAGARAVMTTQACEKLYKARDGTADVRCALSVAEGGHLSWLPQETIVFDRAALRRTIDLTIAPGGTALVAEATLFGRLARGERVRHATFHDRWRVRQGGRLVHAEDFRVGPLAGEIMSRPAALAGDAAVANVLSIGPDAGRCLAAVRDTLGDAGGASAWQVGSTGKLLARIVAPDGYALRQRLVPLLRLLNGEAGLPKVWST